MERKRKGGSVMGYLLAFLILGLALFVFGHWFPKLDKRDEEEKEKSLETNQPKQYEHPIPNHYDKPVHHRMYKRYSASGKDFSESQKS